MLRAYEIMRDGDRHMDRAGRWRPIPRGFLGGKVGWKFIRRAM